MKKEFLIITILIIGISPIFADEKNHTLEIDEHTYDIRYEVNADVLAMAIDQEAKSLLIGIENTQDSQFTVDFQKELLDAENGEFAVLVNGLEVEYEIFSDSKDYTLIFFVPVGTEEIEIIGTHVIPEFPIGVMAIMGIIMTASVIFSKKLGSNFI